MNAVLDFRLADEFVDPETERSLLAALAHHPELYWELCDHLPEGSFLREEAAWTRLRSALLAGEPSPDGGGAQPAVNPREAARRLEDLLLRRQLATLQEGLARSLFGDKQACLVLDQLEENAAVIRKGHKAQVTSGLQWGHELAGQVLELARERLRQRIETGKPVCGIPTGLRSLDQCLNGLNQGLHVLAGAPGAGKTTLSLQVALHAAYEGFPVLYVSYENSPLNLVSKALCARFGGNTNELERGYADLEKLEISSGELSSALERLAVVEGSSSLTVSQVRGKGLQLMGRHGTKQALIVFDYLQRGAHGIGYDQIRQNVSSLAGELRDLSNSLNSPVLAISSQNRSAGGYGAGLGSAALDSLKESGDLEYSADSVIFLKRSERTAQAPARAVDLVVAKNRYGEADVTIPLFFRPDRGQLREA